MVRISIRLAIEFKLKMNEKNLAEAVFYGPHACEFCGKSIVTTSKDVPAGCEFIYEAAPEPIYPNTKWAVHECVKTPDVSTETPVPEAAPEPAPSPTPEE